MTPLAILPLLRPLLLAAEGASARPPLPVQAYVEKHCLDCHDSDRAKGGLDLSALALDPADPKGFATWVKVHDRVAAGEMPPGRERRPPRPETGAFLTAVAGPLAAADLAREAREGRATRRRLNRFEYENTPRDLLSAPWLQVKEMLPEDGEAHRFNKVGDALDVSRVQMAQYLEAAEHAIRQVLAAESTPPERKTVRYRTRDMRSFAGRMLFNEFNRSPERATFPVLGSRASRTCARPAFRWSAVRAPTRRAWAWSPARTSRSSRSSRSSRRRARAATGCA